MELSKQARKAFAEAGKRGGKMRAERLTEAERKAISSQGGKARWEKWRAEKAAS